MIKIKIFKALIILFFGFFSLSTYTQGDEYSVSQAGNNGITEYRFIFAEHHFMTLIDDKGTLNFRPHPGFDINGWGSSWYAQPFLPGAMLSHTKIEKVEPIEKNKEGIIIKALGKVSRHKVSSYGTWNIEMCFRYNKSKKRINGKGKYSITLDGPLSSATGDLNLFKIASNYLDDVPLLSGRKGDTGDMSYAKVVGDDFNFTWFPPKEPGHFPTNKVTNKLSIDVIGQYNNVDTKKQGYEPIEAAYKPSLKVVLTSKKLDTPMIFGGVYDDKQKDLFYANNIGITPLVLKHSTEIKFEFDVEFESIAVEFKRVQTGLQGDTHYSRYNFIDIKKPYNSVNN